MSYCSRFLRLLLIPLSGIISVTGNASLPADSVILYTTYTKISVPPGEAIDYTIDIINTSKEIRNTELSVTGIPKGWNYSMKFGTWDVGQISLLPTDRKSVSLRVEVPLKVRKGSYRFKVMAGESISLPLVINVTEEGTYKTEFTTQQANMEGHANSNFYFNAVLKNMTSEKQSYALMAVAPRGWNVTFKANSVQATSVEAEPNTTRDISVEINPPGNIEAGTYTIPVTAGNSTTSASLNLDVVITGTFSMELTTPTGLLSTDITAGDEKRLELIIRNTGSSVLSGIDMSSSTPLNWNVSFDPKKVDRIEPGKSAQVFAVVKAGKKAIAGDYITNIEARAPEVSSKISFRISVETSVLLGWLGILIIIAALGSVYFLFRKYGRR
ncbi:MAG: NEW3 domain-containing protein [Bacteroidales bacterium]